MISHTVVRNHLPSIHLEPMSSEECQNGGVNLRIQWSTMLSPIGQIFIASTEKGICSLGFVSESGQIQPLIRLQKQFPNAEYHQTTHSLHTHILTFLEGREMPSTPIPLHLKGTPFQLRVWTALLTIPPSSFTTYGTLAQKVDAPNAYRAVGTAVGQNPVAVLIPCHRVRPSTGALGNYHWGSAIKQAIIDWEANIQRD